MPNILGTVENTEGQTSQEIAWGQIASHGPDGESGAFWEDTNVFPVVVFLKKKISDLFFIKKIKPTPQEARHILQLRDVVLPKVTVFGQQRKVLQVFPAGVGGVQLVQLPVDHSPRLHLLLCELDPRNGIPAATGTFSQHQVCFQSSCEGFLRKNSLFVGHGQISKVLSPLSVDVVLETLVDGVETYETGVLSEWVRGA